MIGRQGRAVAMPPRRDSPPRPGVVLPDRGRRVHRGHGIPLLQHRRRRARHRSPAALPQPWGSPGREGGGDARRAAARRRALRSAVPSRSPSTPSPMRSRSSRSLVDAVPRGTRSTSPACGQVAEVPLSLEPAVPAHLRVPLRPRQLHDPGRPPRAGGLRPARRDRAPASGASPRSARPSLVGSLASPLFRALSVRAILLLELWAGLGSSPSSSGRTSTCSRSRWSCRESRCR
jgi:hypothetical protein